MPERIVVDADRPERRAAANQTERYDKSMAIAAIVQSIPRFVWAAPLVLLFGFIIMALWTYRGKSLEDFTSGALMWLARLLIAAGIVLLLIGLWKCYKLYHAFMLDAANRRIARAGVTKALAAARAQELKNDQLQAKIDLEKQLPYVLQWAVQNGYPVKYGKEGLEIYQAPGVRVLEQGNALAQLGAGGAGALPGLAANDGFPTYVRYEDVRGRVPAGHILVGVGRASVVETKEETVGACVWIVGLSGTGKTSTTVIRVEERTSVGHGLLGVDPHWFKDDSLYHAIYETLDGQPGPYKRAFAKPMACTPEQSKKVLQYFLDEFVGRKSGRIPKPWHPITLLVDEVGALMDPATPEEEEIAKMLPTIARICGQEARNFYMGGIFISQQATGLAWLRKVALMVIVHQLLMQSEKELACNGDKATAKAMESWPVGRTYIFGVGFTEGPRTVQQPYFHPGAVSAGRNGFSDDEDNFEEDRFVEENVVDAMVGGGEQGQPAPVPALAGDMRRVYDACLQLANLGERVSSRNVERLTGIDKDRANGMMNDLAKMGYIDRPSKAV